MKIDSKTFRNILILGTLLIIIAYMVFHNVLGTVFNALTPLLFAFVLYYLLRPITLFFDKKLNHNISVWLTFIVVTLILVGFIFALIPAVSNSVVSIINIVKNTSAEDFLKTISKIPFISNYFDTSSLEAFTQTIFDLLNQYFTSIISYASSVVISIKNWAVSLFVYLMGLLMAFYLLKDTEPDANVRTTLFIQSMLPEKIANFVIKLGKLADESVKKYLIGKMYASLVFGILIFVFSYLINIFTPLKIPYIPLLALLLVIGNLIPYVGSIVATIPSLIICLFSGIWEATAFLIVIIVVQTLDSVVITPKIVGDKVGLKPFWVLAGVTVVGGITGSIIGMIISVPIIAILIQLAEEQMDNFSDRLKEISNRIKSNEKYSDTQYASNTSTTESSEEKSDEENHEKSDENPVNQNFDHCS